jgi:hypothetical protein
MNCILGSSVVYYYDAQIKEDGWGMWRAGG